MFQGRIIEYTFFFSVLAFVGYVAFQIFFPFLTALALATITVLICYPMYRFLLRYVTKQNRTIASILATLVVFAAIVAPISLVSTLLVNEFLSFYRSLDTATQLPIDGVFDDIEAMVQSIVPGFEINLADQFKQSAAWFAGNIGTIFAGTVSVVFTFLIAMFGSFYLFRDGERLVAWLVSISPLKDAEDRVILDRIARSVRSVVTGTVLVSILQGTLAATGFALFGIERALLWGTVGALGALLPGFGTATIMIPAVLYLVFTGALGNAIGLLVWTVMSILIIDNFISPYLMSRGNNLHPFVVLLSVLGGLSLFGPIGFVVGPVMVSLFMVLLEIYSIYVADGQKLALKKKR